MKNFFDGITLTRIATLHELLANSEIRDINTIKRRYLEKAVDFEDTLSFFQHLKIVRRLDDEVILSGRFRKVTPELFCKVFLYELLLAKGEIGNQLTSFLMNFHIDNGVVCFYATPREKIQYSGVRNLLLELDFVSSNSDDAGYVVNDDYMELFIKHFSRRTLSPEALQRKIKINDAIGLAAEYAVIESEIKRLNSLPLDELKVEHTSQTNALAGYDIRSFENYFDTKSRLIERYIEVKAVSKNDTRFFWSQNEIKMAKILGERYYLYLLPVITNNTFDFENLTIIKNPYQAVYCNEVEWRKIEESVSFSKVL